MFLSLILTEACTEAPLSHEFKGKELKTSVNIENANVKTNLNKESSTIVIPPKAPLPISIGPEPVPEPFLSYVEPPSYEPIIDSVVLKKDTIYDFAAIMPEYPGGQKALLSYIASNLIYPQIAKEIGLEGKVIVSFVVFEDGTLHEATILRGIKENESCNKEALRLIGQMPNWIPGKNQQGELIKVRMRVPVVFKLN